MSIDDAALMERQKLARGMLQMRANQADFASSRMSLKKQTQKCILNNKEYFYKLAQRLHPHNPFSRISNSMKNELIEMHATMRMRVKDPGMEKYIIQLLLNEEMTSFPFPTRLEITKAQINELWDSFLEVRPPNLHTLVWKNIIPDKNWNFRPYLNSLLTVPVVLPNIVVLQLETLKCTDEDLVNIADHLTKLRVLDVLRLYRVSRTGILALRRLTLLEEFVFTDCPTELVLKQCLELLPHLHIIGNRLEVIPFWDRNEREMMKTMGNALSQMEGPCILQLHHLGLNDNEQVLDNISLPELRVLKVSGSIAMHPWLFGGVPKLTELHLYGMDYRTWTPLLAQVGRQLQYLRTADTMLPGLDVVLEACPNLTQLHVDSLNVGASQLRPDMLKHLKSLRIVLTNDYRLEKELLLQILSLAPELRSIEFSLPRNIKDLEALAELAEEGTCMRHLETIKIESRSSLSELERLSMTKMRVSCSINCPRLKWFYLFGF